MPTQSFHFMKEGSPSVSLNQSIPKIDVNLCMVCTVLWTFGPKPPNMICYLSKPLWFESNSHLWMLFGVVWYAFIWTTSKSFGIRTFCTQLINTGHQRSTETSKETYPGPTCALARPMSNTDTSLTCVWDSFLISIIKGKIVIRIRVRHLVAMCWTSLQDLLTCDYQNLGRSNQVY